MQHIEEIGRKITQHKTYGLQTEGVAFAEGGLFFITFIRKVMKIKYPDNPVNPVKKNKRKE